MPNYSNILIIRLGALGDVVSNFPLMQAIRRHYPTANITFLTTPLFKDLLERSSYFDQIWTVDRWSPLQLRHWTSFARKLRAQNFTHVYDLQRNDRTLIMSYLAPAALRQRWYGRKGHPDIPAYGEIRNEEIPSVEELNTSWLDADIEKYKIPSPYVVIVPGCSPQHPYKRWPAQHYAGVINALRAQGYSSVLLGTSAEKNVLEDIAKLAPTAINLCGQTSLFEVAALAKRAKVALGNDTGPMHMASIAACPTISLFSGMTNPQKSKPVGNRSIVLQAQPIENISVGAVLEKIFFCLNEWPHGDS